MKKILRAFLVLIVGFIFTKPVNAEFYASRNSLQFNTGTIRIQNGTTYTYRSLYMYTCSGGNKYILKGLYPGSLDPSKTKFKCDDYQDPKVFRTSNGCTSNNTCVPNSQYYCIVTFDLTCPPRVTTTTTTTKPPTPTKTTTRSKTQSTGGGYKTTRRTTQVTEAPTVPTTEITTEETTKAVSNNTNIKSISVRKNSIGYKSTKDEYRFRIAYGVKSVEIEVELEDPKAKYEVTGNTEFDDEKTEEEIKIVVTAEDGITTKEVKIIAEKFKPSETDCTLANIYVKDYSINYEKNTFDYSVTLGKEVKTLDIETVKQYDSQIVNVSGNENLKNKSNIVIEVEAPSGEICTYTLKVKKNSSVGKYIIIIIVLLLALGVAGYFLYRYINKSNGLYKYE